MKLQLKGGELKGKQIAWLSPKLKKKKKKSANQPLYSSLINMFQMLLITFKPVYCLSPSPLIF